MTDDFNRILEVQQSMSKAYHLSPANILEVNV